MVKRSGQWAISLTKLGSNREAACSVRPKAKKPALTTNRLTDDFRGLMFVRIIGIRVENAFVNIRYFIRNSENCLEIHFQK